MKIGLLTSAVFFAVGCGAGDVIQIVGDDGGGGRPPAQTTASRATSTSGGGVTGLPSQTTNTVGASTGSTTGNGGSMGGTCGTMTCSATQQCCFVSLNGQNVEACVAPSACAGASQSSSGSTRSISSRSATSTSGASAGCTATSCTAGVCCLSFGGGAAGNTSCQTTCPANSIELCTLNGRNQQGTCPTGMVCRALGGGGNGMNVCQPAMTMDAGGGPLPTDAGGRG